MVESDKKTKSKTKVDKNIEDTRATKIADSADAKASASAKPGKPAEPAKDANKLGTYELRSELGRGAMARVWRAWDTTLEREVAIKEPLFDDKLSEEVLSEMAARFVKEGKAAARLNHPGIVTIYTADVYDGRPAIVMELIEGVTLADLLDKGAMQPSVALDALDQLLDAVGYAHSQGVVHRDIKPENIFITKDGRVKLGDFGIAHVEDSTMTRKTQVGQVLGTPGYMAPEQATGAPIDNRTDLFSIGTIAYEMLTGANPFGAGEVDATTLIYRIVHEPVAELPEGIAAGLPADVRPAILAALSKNPNDRPQDAATFKNMLHGGALPKTTAPTLEKAVKSGGGAPKWLPYLAVAAACVVVIAVVFFFATNSGGGGVVDATTESAADTEATGEEIASDEPAFLVDQNGKVAIYSGEVGSTSKLVRVTEILTSELQPGTAALLKGGVQVDSLEAAEELIKLYEEEVALVKSGGAASGQTTTSPTTQTGATIYYVCAGEYITLRTTPSTTAAAVTTIASRQPVEFISASGEWSKVRYGGLEGYVLTQYISTDPNAPINDGTFYVRASEFVTLRSSPSTSATALTTIASRQPVEHISTTGEWSKVRYNGQEGYVLAKFLSPDPNAPLNYDSH